MSSGVHVTVCRHQCHTADRSVLTDHWGWINTESRRQYTATAIHQLAWFMARTRLQEVERHSTTGQRGFLPCICLIFWFNIENKATIYKKRPFIIFNLNVFVFCFMFCWYEYAKNVWHQTYFTYVCDFCNFFCFARPLSFSNPFFNFVQAYVFQENINTSLNLICISISYYDINSNLCHLLVKYLNFF